MNSVPSRRNFLAAGLALPAAASAVGSSGSGQSQSSPARPSSVPAMQYKTLGRTGLKVTTVGMGCMITSDPSVITRAADLGINYFDTARGYSHGNNERMVAAALGARRTDVIISTKSQALNDKVLQQDLETSLRELNTDYIDIWFLHAKSSPDEISDELIEVQQKAKKQGKVRFIGVSTHSGQQQLLPWMVKKG